MTNDLLAEDADPIARGEVCQGQQQQNSQPHQAGRYHQFRQLVAVADMHEEQRHQQHLADRDRERHHGAHGAQVEIGHAGGHAGENQQRH